MSASSVGRAPNAILHILLGTVRMWITRVMQQQLLISMRMSTLLFTIFVIGAILATIVRYRLLTKYSRLPADSEEDDVAASELWLEDESDEESVKDSNADGSYFDEFLSAIRVFGYIDRKVFHELTRHMKTVRVDTDESLLLKDLEGFAVVIDGAMNVYCRSEDDGTLEHINEVNRSAPISSLTSILSLFTEDIELNEQLEHIPASEFTKVNDSLVAVAKEPSTIIVIPSNAFRRLTRKYPKATASIVQVILFRWSQVTLRTCQRYLNFTGEIYETEVKLNEFAGSRSRVPDWLLESAVHRLRASRISDEDTNSSGYPGELLTTTPKRYSRRTSVSSKLGQMSEDAVLRETLVEAMFSIMGFDSKHLAGKNDSGNDSGTQSPSPATSESGLTEYSISSPLPGETGSNYEDIVQNAAVRLNLVHYGKGDKICESGIVFVLSGTIDVGSEVPNKPYQRLHTVAAGALTGYLETISSYSSSFVTLTASSDSCIAVLPKSDFEVIAEAYPLLYITAAKTLTTLLPRPIVQLDFALEWLSIKSGAQLFKQDHTADAIYFVLNGRLRATQKGGKIVGEYGQGSSVGELEVLVGEKYAATTVAIRETELARFPRTIVELLARQHPSITFEMSRMVATSIRARRRTTPEFRTVAILPTASGLPVQEFAQRLEQAYRQNGKKVMMLTLAGVLGYLGRYAFQRMGVLKLKAYLSDLEDRYDCLLYVADDQLLASSAQWTRTCIGQADCVLLIADALALPTFSEYERLVVKSKTTSRAHLVLLHQEKQVEHGSTQRWLKRRPWISDHHHIELPFARGSPGAGPSGAQADFDFDKTTRKSRARQRLQQLTQQFRDELRILGRRRAHGQDRQHQRLRYKNDFNRLARILSGDAVGLVLGGGGARGIAHIGVVQALEDAGIPIDMVGGTSIGAFIGGLYAREYDLVPLYSRAKKFAVRLASMWRLVFDITYPSTAWTTGHEFNRGIWKTFGDSRIEDFWIKYFTNTTNLTHSRMEVHQAGYAWRYIRASMSLAGLVPPIEDKGQMLLDGGYVDNLPVVEMKKMGARYIIAVDVGAVEDTTPLKYGDTLSGLWAMINRWNPLSNTPNVPSMAEIQQRLTYVSSVVALEAAKVTSGLVYLRPPIDPFATLDFGKFEEILVVGRSYGTAAVKRSIETGEFPTIPGAVPATERPKLRFRRHSF